MYNPNIKPTFIPELCTRMFDTSRKNMYNDEFTSYRVDGYLKATPKGFTLRADAQAWENDTMKKLFYEWHPKWATEYKLIPCLKEEATHVWGVGVCGITACLTDKRFKFTNEYVGWTEEHIKEEQENWVKDLPNLLDRMSFDLQVVSGIRHTRKYYSIRTFKGKRYQAMVKEIEDSRQ